MPIPSRGLALPPTAASASTQTLEVGEGGGELGRWGSELFPTLILNQLKMHQQRNADNTDGRTWLYFWMNGLSNDETKMRQTYPPSHAALDGDCLAPESPGSLLRRAGEEGAGPGTPSFYSKLTNQINHCSSPGSGRLPRWREAQSATLALSLCREGNTRHGEEVSSQERQALCQARTRPVLPLVDVHAHPLSKRLLGVSSGQSCAGRQGHRRESEEARAGGSVLRSRHGGAGVSRQTSQN